MGHHVIPLTPAASVTSLHPASAGKGGATLDGTVDLDRDDSDEADKSQTGDLADKSRSASRKKWSLSMPITLLVVALNVLAFGCLIYSFVPNSHFLEPTHNDKPWTQRDTLSGTRLEAPEEHAPHSAGNLRSQSAMTVDLVMSDGEVLGRVNVSADKIHRASENGDLIKLNPENTITRPHH